MKTLWLGVRSQPYLAVWYLLLIVATVVIGVSGWHP